MKKFFKGILFLLCGILGFFLTCAVIFSVCRSNLITSGWIIQNVFFAVSALLLFNVAFRHKAIYEKMQNSVVSKIFWNTTAFCGIVFVVFSVLAGIKIYDSANKPAPPQGLPVISLGGTFYGDKPDVNQKARLDVTYDYLVNNPESKCIVANGAVGEDGRVYGDLMKNYLVEKGIDAERIIVEGQSVDTGENFEYSKKLLEEHELGSRAVVVTTTTHMYRSLLYAEKNGIYANPLCAKNQRITNIPVGFMHEVLGIAEYLIME